VVILLLVAVQHKDLDVNRVLGARVLVAKGLDGPVDPTMLQ
jgi:hypothetical protein